MCENVVIQGKKTIMSRTEKCQLMLVAQKTD